MGELTVPTRNVNLTAHFDRFVESEIASGRYKDASDVMRAGLRLLEQRGREDEEKLAVLRRVATDAFDAIERGEGITIDGEEELAEYIGRIGRRVGRRSRRGPAGA
jgi:antitoxin ParD1/3/4